jgi:O-antigen ligase
MGGGIGSAGYWGARFAPDSLLANTATDSWYVKIWAETGIIGISLHLFILGFIMGKGGSIVLNLQDPVLKSQAMASYASIAGVLLSSYGNQVFGQMPTGMIMNFAIPLVFLTPYFDRKND